MPIASTHKIAEFTNNIRSQRQQRPLTAQVAVRRERALMSRSNLA